MKVKKALLLLIALLLIFAAVSATLANDVVEGRTRNVITTGSVNITIEEGTDDSVPSVLKGTKTEQGTIAFEDVMPTKSYSKEVKISNAAEKCWLRVKVDYSMATPEAGVDYAPAAVIKPNYDESGKWIKQEDGYFYYREPLEKNQSTEKLFTQVTIAPETGNEYAGKTVQMIITAEAVQCKNNMPDSSSVLDVVGWPDSGEGGA